MYKIKANDKTLSMCNSCIDKPPEETLAKFFPQGKDRPVKLDLEVLGRYAQRCDCCGKQADKYYCEIHYVSGPSTFGPLFAESPVEAYQLARDNIRPGAVVKTARGEKWYEKDKEQILIRIVPMFGDQLSSHDWKFGEAKAPDTGQHKPQGAEQH